MDPLSRYDDVVSDSDLRQNVIHLLGSRSAHADFETVVHGLPPGLRGVKAAGQPHTAWQLLEHLRIAQWDILEFSRRANHVSPEFPAGYWPVTDAPDGEAWDRSVEAFRADLRAMIELVRDPATDLFAELPWGHGATVLGEALLVADHNAYHLGQIVTLRRALGAWSE
jgi:hypothetical protein